LRRFAEASFVGGTLPACALAFNGSSPTYALRKLSGDAGVGAFRCAFPTQVIP
jgi:hypothetical protein